MLESPSSLVGWYTACPAFPQSKQFWTCAGVSPWHSKKRFSPSLLPWDRVQSIQEWCVLSGKLLQDEFLQPRKSGCQDLSWFNRYMTFQISPPGIAVLWVDYLREHLFYAQCGREGEGVQGKCAEKDFRGLVSINDLEQAVKHLWVCFKPSYAPWCKRLRLSSLRGMHGAMNRGPAWACVVQEARAKQTGGET